MDGPVLLLEKQPTSRPADELLTIPEVAEFLRISATGVRRLQHQRQIAFIKLGGSIRFLRSDLISYLKAQRVEPIGS